MHIILIYFKKFFLSKRNEWLKFDSVFMYLGIIISVAALATTFIIFEGYEKTLKKTILGVNSHIYFFKPGVDDLNMSDILKIKNFLKDKDEIIHYTPVISGQAISSSGDRAKGSLFKSIDWRNLNQASMYHDAINEGTWELKNESDIVIGKYLAKMLNVGVGDQIQVMSTSSLSTGLTGIRYKTKKMNIVGIFYSGMYEYDSRFIFMNVDTAKHFNSNESDFTLLEVRLKEEFINKASEIAIKWDKELNHDYQISSWMQFNGNLFSLLTLEKWVLTIIISFLIVVAGFNVITTTLASIKEKRKEIGLLKTIGLTGNKIALIFMSQISLISSICIIIGIIFGIGIGYLVSYQTMISLRGEVYLLDKIYIHIDFIKMIIIFFIAFIIINLSCIIPLRQISKMREIEILRYRK